MAPKNPTLTLTIDKSTNRVVFAESDKDFVDILLSFLTLPLSTIVSLSNNNSTPLPCLNNLYKSVKDLNPEYFKTNPGKELLLRPSYEAEMELCLDQAVNYLDGDKALTYYACKQDCAYEILSPYLNTKCHCGVLLSRKVQVEREMGKEGVFLKGVMRFIVTDDFVIMPASTQAVVKLISGLCVGNLEERNVKAGRSEVLALLQSSLASNRAFTDVFIAREMVLKKKFDNLTLKNDPKLSSQSDNNDNDNIHIKIIIDKHEKKVLYAESNQRFVDLLFSFLAYPAGSVVKNLNLNSHITCFDNLYSSALKPDVADSFINYQSKEYVINPKLPSFLMLKKSFIELAKIIEQKRYYMCRTPYCDSDKVSIIPNAPCECGRITNKRMGIFNPYGHEGFVEEATYVISDDLIVTPLRSLSCVARLIADAKEGIEELLVKIGQKEILLLLEAALCSGTALTDAFMKAVEDK